MSLPENFSVWEGVFDSFEEAGGDLDAFEADPWIAKQREETAQIIKGISEKGSISKDYPLSLAAAVLLSKQDAISIIDFGGGMGAQYFELIGKIPEAHTKINYCVVEGKKTIHAAPREVKDFSGLSFHESFDAISLNAVDIFHIGSTLQYIEDWKGLIKDIVKRFKPSYFVFSDLLAGDIPTFVSHQIYYDKRIPHLFLSLSDVQAYLTSSLSFELLYISRFRRKILNQDECIPNHALPESHRLTYSHNLLFKQA